MNPSNDELELLRQLRKLPREREPARDLWAGIESRLGGATTASRGPRPTSWGWIALATAASLALAIGLAWRPAQIAAPATTASQNDREYPRASGSLVRREAEAITLEYRLALEPFAAGSLPPELSAAATELDASARELRRALREQPEATYLLDRLRHTYDQRLKLTQRAMLG